MKDVKIIVATHKQYPIAQDDSYLPVHVGAKGKEIIKSYQRDDEGENISDKNPYYCELTGLFWAWKNLKNDMVGLVHYRRYFTNKKIIPYKEDKKFKVVLSTDEIQKLVENNDIILPRKRRYYIENLYSHYKHTLQVEPLDITRKILEKRCPEYISEFERLKKRRSAHMFNMFIMKKEILDEYCSWLFPILEELETKINIEEYDPFQARFYGRISELLLDVWINTNKLDYKEVRIMDMQNINWLRKGSSFLQAKFMGKKYEKSF